MAASEGGEGDGTTEEELVIGGSHRGRDWLGDCIDGTMASELLEC